MISGFVTTQVLRNFASLRLCVKKNKSDLLYQSLLNIKLLIIESGVDSYKSLNRKYHPLWVDLHGAWCFL